MVVSTCHCREYHLGPIKTSSCITGRCRCYETIKRHPRGSKKAFLVCRSRVCARVPQRTSAIHPREVVTAAQEGAGLANSRDGAFLPFGTVRRRLSPGPAP